MGFTATPRGPLPKRVAIAFLVVGPLFLYFAVSGLVTEPPPRVLRCSREAPDRIACQPGNARGATVVVRRESGKNARDCFTLGDAWLCGGDVRSAATRVNSLAVGAKTEVDITPPKQFSGIIVGALMGLVMTLGGLFRLLGFGSIQKSPAR